MGDVLVALAAPIAALVGVYLAQRNARQLKELELREHRKVRAAELQQEASRLFRSERRELYLTLLRSLRPVRDFWDHIETEVYSDEKQQARAEAMREATEGFYALWPEIEVSASIEVLARFEAFEVASGQCMELVSDEAFFNESEEVRREAVSRALQRWKEVDLEEKYVELGAQIRRELDHLALHTDLALDPAESKSAELQERS